LRARRAIGREGLIVGGFLALGIWGTWPLTSHLFSTVTGFQDVYGQAWKLWWVKEQLFSLQSPYYSDDLLSPVGSYLASGALMPMVGVVLSPLTELLGPGATRNLASLGVPVLCAYVTYRLALRLGLTRSAGLVAGALYGFSTILTVRAAVHLSLAAGAIFAPLALLYAVRYWQRRGPGDAALLGAVLGAAVLVDQTTAVFAATIAGGYLVAVFVRGRTPPQRWVPALGVAALAAVVVAAPQLYMTLRQDSVDPPADSAALAASYRSYDASLLSMLSPSPNLRVQLPGDLDGLTYRGHPGELITAFGWGLLALAAAGFWFARRRPLVLGLLAAFAGAVVLALGPEITLTNNGLTPLPVMRGGQQLSSLMPYTWLVQVPGLDELRIAARFTQLALLPAALLAGLGLQALLARGRVFAWVAVGLLGLALLELGWAPRAGPGTLNLDKQVPLTRDELYAPVRADSSRSIVVDLPLAFVSGHGGPGEGVADLEGMFRATEHQHPVATGYLARLPQDRVDAITSHRFYADLIAHQSTVDQGGRPLSSAAGGADARAMGVGWVVIWPDLGVSTEVRRYVRAVGFELVREVDGIELYRAPGAWAL
jgi:hypothetical protein